MQLNLVSTNIWLHEKPVDFRKSINGLADIVINQYSDLAKNAIFVFYSKSGDKIKCLFWHGNGFIMLYKRLEKGRFTTEPGIYGNYQLDEQKLSWMLAGLDWVNMSSWKNLEFDEII